MGYCNRCGEISNGGKCRKCGGRSVASTVMTLSGDKESVRLTSTTGDRWQLRYADSILSQRDKSPSPSVSASTPVSCAKRPTAASVVASTSPTQEGRRNKVSLLRKKANQKKICDNCCERGFGSRDPCQHCERLCSVTELPETAKVPLPSLSTVSRGRYATAVRPGLDPKSLDKHGLPHYQRPTITTTTTTTTSSSNSSSSPLPSLPDAHTRSEGTTAAASGPVSSGPLPRRRCNSTITAIAPFGEVLSPSQLFMSRTRELPKLGGSKVCPHCRNSIAVWDETPGPRASRWHKKCLKCTKCKKQMDSSARVYEGDTGEWLVYCRNCTDKNPTPTYVR